VTDTLQRRPVTLTVPKPVTVVAILIGVIPFAVHAVAALQGYFGHDDFVIFHRAAAANPFDPGYLFQDHNGHIAPGMFLVAWFVTELSPLSVPHAMVPLLLVQAAATLMLWRLLVRCFGVRWGLLLPFAVFTFSPLILYPTLWWAAGVQAFPLLLAMFGALNAHVRYLQEGGRKHVVVTALWAVAGLAFFEKAALFIGLLAGITVLVEQSWSLGRHWRVWVLHGSIVAVYFGLYSLLTVSQVGDTPLSWDVAAEFVRRAVADTCVPGLFGGLWTDPKPGGGVTTPALTLRLITAGLALAVVAGGVIVGRGRAAVAWSLLAGYLAVDLALVILTRLHQVGPLIGNDPRYIVDAVPVAVLCAAFAYFRPSPPPARHTPVILGLVALLAVNATVSFQRLAPGLQFPESREYVTNARAALDADPGITLYDTRAPQTIIHEWFGADATASRVIGLLPGPPRFDQPSEVMYQLDDHGRPQRIKDVKDAVAGRSGPYQDCGYSVGYQTATIPLSGRVEGRRLLRLEYYTTAAGPVTLRIGRTTTDIHFLDGLHELYIVVDGSFDRVDINRATQVTPMCVVNARIGVPLT
jgi:hypothetical protein